MAVISLTLSVSLRHQQFTDDMLNTLALPAVRIDAYGELLNTNPAWSTDYTQVIEHLQQIIHPWDLMQLKSAIVTGKVDHIVVRRFGRGRWNFNNAIIVDRQHNSTSLIFAPLPPPPHVTETTDELLGNIVHSTNNYLSAMMGFCELAMLDIKPDHIAHGQLQTVLESGNNAVSFTRDLLACAHRSVLRPQAVPWRAWLSTVIQPHNVVTLGSFPDVKAYIDDLVLTRALSDIVQFLREQQGVVSVESGVIDMTSAQASPLRILPGRYTWTVLSETARRLSGEQAQQLFQPYFATKSLSGKKGLGLAPAAGIIWQSKGAVWATNESEGGVAVIVLLPAENMEQFGAPPPRDSLRAPATPHVVPMVCSDTVLPALAQQLLQSLPYTITPITADEAAQIDWTTAKYPFYITTQLHNPYWQGTDKHVIVWSSFAQNRLLGGTTQMNVRLAFDATNLTQAVMTLTKRAMG